jgi:hypothetical protein
MGSKLKTGTLLYFSRGFLSKKWKEGYFVLYEDSSIHWFEKPSDKKPEGAIRIKDIANFLSVGPFTRCKINLYIKYILFTYFFFHKFQVFQIDQVYHQEATKTCLFASLKLHKKKKMY